VCFSAEASFVTGAVLLPAGVYCTVAAVRKNRSYLPHAVAPLLFAVQQFAEAGVWAGLDRDDPAVVRPFALVFLFFAVAFWPAWASFAAAFLEPRPRWRGCLFALSALGFVLGLTCYLPAAGRYDEWVQVRIAGHSVQYDLSRMPAAETVVGAVWRWVYLGLVCLPLLTTRDRRLGLFGVAVATAAVIAYLVFRYAFASVWCFFAAALSAQLCYVLYRVPPNHTSLVLAPAP
jgi:MFS family permease